MILEKSISALHLIGIGYKKKVMLFVGLSLEEVTYRCIRDVLI